MIRETSLRRGLAPLAASLLAAALLGVPAGSTAVPSAVPTVSDGAAPDPAFGPAQRQAALTRARTQAPAVAKHLGLSGDQRLLARSVERDVDGSEHVRYDRRLNGLPVIGGDLVVHRSPGGAIADVDLAESNPIAATATTDPRVSARVATTVASRRQQLSAGTVGDPELAVWAVAGVPRLAWQVHVEGTDRTGGPVRRVEYVDATSGRYIAGWSELQHADGTGKSLYSGKVKIQTVKKKGTFLLKDASRGGSTTVDVLNQEDGATYLPGKIFKDADNTWGNGKPSHRQSAAVDVAFGTAKTWDYFKKTFNRKGIRNNGKGAKSRVHYGKNYDNAFWDDSCFCMTYGDGGTQFKPLTSLDVAGHEMVHGITSNTAGLLYIGESGGLNEATSDIFGAMVEFSVNGKADRGDYYIGEKIAKVSGLGHPFLRRMDAPSSDGAGHECWTLTMGADDVHYTSGPANKFFYMLAEGTSPKNIGGRAHDATPCAGGNFGGIGKAPAAAIWYRALTRYMTSTDSYLDARDATIRAARDLNGGHCDEVERAWDAVAVPTNYWTCAGALDEGASVLGSNPGFENGSSGWNVSGTAVVTDDPGWGFSHSGAWWAAFNGRGEENTSVITRTVTVPNTPTATLRFSMLAYSEDSPFTIYDTFDVLVNGSPIPENMGHWNNTYANNTYLRWDVPMAPWAGQTVTLQFRGVEDWLTASQFLLDDVSLTPR